MPNTATPGYRQVFASQNGGGDRPYATSDFLVAVLLTGTVLLSGCIAKGKESPGKGKGAPELPPPTVTIAVVKAVTIPVTGDFVGQSSAIDTVNIVPRVTGFLEQVFFTEGVQVHKGDVLFRIEQASYLIAIESAQGQLAKDQAMLVKYQRDVARLTPLTAQHAATQTDLDIAVSGAAQQEAAMKIDQAAIDTAKLNLTYTIITSPIEGIIGALGVTRGNLVSPGQSTALATISSSDPIYVYFTVPEALYLGVSRKSRGRLSPPPVILSLLLADGKPMPNKGFVNFTDRTVNPQTGTLSLRGVFPNPGGLLRPGEFARVQFVTEERPGTVLVPKAAVTETLNTKAVLILDNANKALQKTVTLEGDYHDYFIVHSGLHGGERVVVEGAAKVKPGMTVNPAEAPKANAAGKNPTDKGRKQ